MDFGIFLQLGAAFVLASLVGLEREHIFQTENFKGFGGVRTFALIGLMGALAQILSDYSPWILTVISIGFFGLIIAAYILATHKTEKSGATSEVAAMLVFIIGILCALEYFVIATTVAIMVLMILHFKAPLHNWAKQLKDKELVSTIQFMIIAFVILPLLPNEAFGPYNFFNPYIIWLMVVFISGISFASYIAIKLFGEKRGIAFTGFLSGFISSTALTLSFSGESKKNKSVVNPYALAVIVASTAMFFRVLVEVAVFSTELLKTVYVPMVAMGATGVAFAFYYWFKKDPEVKELKEDAMDIKSPFSLWPALRFAMFFTLILFLSRFGMATLGEKGVYITSFFSGFFDVDAITLSMARAVSEEKIAVDVAATAITIATMTNTVVKASIMFLFGARKVSLRVLGAFACVLGVGGASLFFL